MNMVWSVQVALSLVFVLMTCDRPRATAQVQDAGVAPGVVDAAAPEIPLPARWPKALPMYPGTKVFSVEPMNGGLELRGEAPASPRKVAAFYRGVLQGYQVAEDELNMSDQMQFTFSRGGKTLVSVLVSGPEDHGLVVLLVDAAMLN